MVHGAADISMRDYDPRRFGDYATKDWQVIKAKEDYCLRHEIPFPHFNRLEGRPVKPSPLYERLKAKGAVFEEVFGHERPRWFAKGRPAEDIYGFGRTERYTTSSAKNAARCVSVSASWTSPPSPRWRWLARAPRRCWIGWSPTACRKRSAASR